jgi:hypothetical protein
VVITFLPIYVIAYIVCNHPVLLKCSETWKWREKFLSKKFVVVNEYIAHNRIINRSDPVEFRNVGKHLCKIRCK